MSTSIPIPKVRTTGKQDIRLLETILSVCENRSIPRLGLPLHLKGVSDVLDERSIDFDSSEFAEGIRARNFLRYVSAALDFLLAVRMCVLDHRILDVGMRAPQDVSYVKVTWFGRFFAAAPFFVQFFLVKVLQGLLFCVRALRKYRWIFSVVSVLFASFSWLKAHHITGFILVMAIFIGLAAAVIVAWLAETFWGDLDGD